MPNDQPNRILYTGGNMRECVLWCGDEWRAFDLDRPEAGIRIRTINDGRADVCMGDWIVRASDGTLHVEK
jgi:hypothetical protein